ncbi:MAG: hypothetical protein GTO02_20355, partial [Candidatus Dadabacteria bacterium]|nr:hypothetical protein [Candidatus Dadabacteria bacterium]NIQ16649.1 hypothetical protein [Candidatus Dadabacteria bacterium]
GEEVVARANFLIDSESKIQSAVATWENNSSNTEESNEEMKEIKIIETEPQLE